MRGGRQTRRRHAGSDSGALVSPPPGLVRGPPRIARCPIDSYQLTLGGACVSSSCGVDLVSARHAFGSPPAFEFYRRALRSLGGGLSRRGPAQPDSPCLASVRGGRRTRRRHAGSDSGDLNSPPPWLACGPPKTARCPIDRYALTLGVAGGGGVVSNRLRRPAGIGAEVVSTLSLISAPAGRRRLTDLPSPNPGRRGPAVLTRSDFVAAERGVRPRGKHAVRVPASLRWAGLRAWQSHAVELQPRALSSQRWAASRLSDGANLLRQANCHRPKTPCRLNDLSSLDNLRHGLALRIRSDFVAAEPWCPSERQAHCCVSAKLACSPVDCKQREFSGRSDGHRKAKEARRAGNGSRHPHCQPMPCRTQSTN